MLPLHLDYQHRGGAASPVRWVVLAAGVLSAIIAVHDLLSLRHERNELDIRIARAERKAVPVLRGDLSSIDSKVFADEIKVANAIAAQLTFPWERLLEAVELSAAKNVALLSLQPEVPRKVLRLTAEAKNKADMLGYVRRLSENGELSVVHLMEHQVQDQTPGTPVRFSVQASWEGAPNDAR